MKAAQASAAQSCGHEEPRQTFLLTSHMRLRPRFALSLRLKDVPLVECDSPTQRQLG